MALGTFIGISRNNTSLLVGPQPIGEDHPVNDDVTTLRLVDNFVGGGPTNLDGVITVGVTVPRLYFFMHTTGGQFYWLRAGTDTEAIPNIIRPDDYNGTTNAKVFERAV